MTNQYGDHSKYHLQFSHWGVSVLAPRRPDKNFGEAVAHYSYPVGNCGPADCTPEGERIKQRARDFCASLNA